MITVNGKPFETAEGKNILQLIERLNLDVNRVVVELNREIIPRSSFSKVTLKSDDRVEVLNFVGGG